LFWAPWGYKFDRTRLEQNLSWLAAFRPAINYLRIWGQVGGPFWEDRTIDPSWPDYDDVMRGTVDLASAYGFRVEPTIFAGADLLSSGQRVQLVDRLASILGDRIEKLAHWEIANEAWQTGLDDIDELRSLTRQLKQCTTVPVAITSDHFDNTVYQDLYSGAIADIGTYHFDRSLDYAEGPWRPVRQPWCYPNEIGEGLPPGSSNEPIGPYASVASEEEPVRLIAQSVVSWISGLPFSVLHAGPGIFGGGHAAGPSGSPANFWEVPCLEPTLRGLAAMQRVLPGDLPGWDRQNAHTAFGGRPFDVDAFWPDGDDDHGVVRCYSGTRGQRFVSILLGIQDYVRLTARWEMTANLVSLLSGNIVSTRTLKAGDQWQIGEGETAYLVMSQ
jgi:hypothetical protein